MNLTYLPSADIVERRDDIIVNTVNCVSVMGKGVALAFKEAFPEIMQPYRRDCGNGVIRPGTATVYRLRGDQFWCAMATKDHWRDPSRLEWVDAALRALAVNAAAVGARSIAIPPAGCGNGGLDFRDVAPLIAEHLAAFDVTVTCAPPSGGPRRSPARPEAAPSRSATATRAAKTDRGSLEV